MALRILFFLLFILSAIVAPAQKRAVTVYDEIPAGGLDLKDGWLYSPNDSMAFAAPGFDDRRWDSIAPVTPVYQLPQLDRSPTGWLRLHFRIGPAAGKEALCFSVWQNCASEIYLDGKLIARHGVVSHDPARVVPLGMNLPGQLVSLAPGSAHVLAVRFAVWRGASHLRIENNFFSPTLISFKGFQAIKDATVTNDVFFVIYVAIFLLLSILHLAFFRYDPAQRANLYFAVYTLTSALIFCMVCLQDYFQDARLHALVVTPLFVINLTGGIWIIYALGSLFQFSVKRWSVVSWVVFAALAAYIIFVRLNLAWFFGGLAFFTVVDFIIAAKGLLAKKRGAGIISAGLFISMVTGFLLAYRYALVNGFYLDEGMFSRNLLDMLATMSPAIGISIYLAREFALNSSLLREKLVQVETLSAQSLALQQERQHLLEQQKEELEKQVNERTAELQSSLTNLKTAQAQLIQSEKMASLGELTAGIAHEIQNPLNFVNNFSDVNAELIDELKAELEKGDIGEAQAIACDLQENERKINMHGKRADAIVKGMLEHSRLSSGKKELTDINKLADEYLRLAYHGVRAKDKSLQASLVAHFDAALPLVNVIPQDIGRVLLNVFSNAFYAVQQKAKKSGAGFVPVVKITTATQDGCVVLTVNDNGDGIPDNIKDKIMQPFFTTKPTGQGTGLGLSLSYDIVTRGHGGEMLVKSKENEFAEFVISLPV